MLERFFFGSRHRSSLTFASTGTWRERFIGALSKQTSLAQLSWVLGTRERFFSSLHVICVLRGSLHAWVDGASLFMSVCGARVQE